MTENTTAPALALDAADRMLAGLDDLAQLPQTSAFIAGARAAVAAIGDARPAE